MSVTGTQIFGLVMGSIPGPNFVASITKFAYYNSQESNLKDAVSRKEYGACLDRAAMKVNVLAKEVFENLEEEIGNLKWYAFLQIIPLVGVYFAWAEKQLLERINKVLPSEDISQINQEEIEPPKKIEQQFPKNVIKITEENFEAKTREGNVAILIYENHFFVSLENFSKVEIEGLKLAAVEKKSKPVQLKDCYGLVAYKDGKQIRDISCSNVSFTHNMQSALKDTYAESI